MNVNVSSIDTDETAQGGVQNTITWIDSVSEGQLTYSILRNTTNDASTATEIADGIAADVEQFIDTTVVPLTPYYYFVEVSKGSENIISDGNSINTVGDKALQAESFQTENPDQVSYNPATDSYELV